MKAMAIKLGNIVLTGRDVVLRPPVRGDAEALAKAASESREEYGYTPVPEGPDRARVYIDHALRMRKEGLRYPFAIIYLGRIVGSTSFWDVQPWNWPAGSPMQRQDRPDVCEIGSTWLAASAQRTRCNTEAKFLLLSHAFETWAVHRVMLRTDARNSRSRAAIERLGVKFEGIHRADKPAEDGSVRDSAFFSIVAAEWLGVKAKLVEKMSRGEL
jgi:RimJ/RimL family protein N-acetyltransferase